MAARTVSFYLAVVIDNEGDAIANLYAVKKHGSFDTPTRDLPALYTACRSTAGEQDAAVRARNACLYGFAAERGFVVEGVSQVWNYTTPITLIDVEDHPLDVTCTLLSTTTKEHHT